MFQVESPADPLEKSTEVVEDRGLYEQIIPQVKSHATSPWFAPSRPIDLFLLVIGQDTENPLAVCKIPLFFVTIIYVLMTSL